jgi:hypothetical protein
VAFCSGVSHPRNLFRLHTGDTYDSQGANVLPSLLEQGHQVVDGQHDVSDQLVLSHANVSDGNTETQHLLELELDGALDVIDLGGQVLGVGDGGGELSSLGKTGTEQTGDLLDQLLRCEERIVLASHLLDQLLVLVELLQIVDAHELESVVLGTVNVVLVSENATPTESGLANFFRKLCARARVRRGKTNQMLMFGRGTMGSLTVPEKRLSRMGS